MVYIQKDSHASTTYNRNLGAIRKHIFPMLGDKSIDDITQDEILDIATKMQANVQLRWLKGLFV